MAKITITKIEQATCPYCNGGNVSYYGFTSDDDGGYYDVECDDCGRWYQECYDLVFSGHMLKDKACSYVCDNSPLPMEVEVPDD